MKIGMIGLGKLGLPCAVGMALKGHEVMGYDIVSANMSKTPKPYLETGPDGIEPFNVVLADSSLKFGSLEDVVRHAEILFLAVQTPHDGKYEGVNRLPKERRDFDYRYLTEAVNSLTRYLKPETILTVISTVLPGTMKREILPNLPDGSRFCYNPYFIAMGTTMRDFLKPEFVLLGGSENAVLEKMAIFYKSITDAPQLKTNIENAELVKVLFNTFLGTKVAFINMVMELCHKLPETNVDVVTQALGMSNERIMSTRYLSGGMGDGGGCHPRDNIALSWLARETALSYDWFEHIMTAREKQAEWIADLVCAYDMKKVILGYSYKEETNLSVGSPAVLIANILKERGEDVTLSDPFVDDTYASPTEIGKAVFLIGTRHRKFLEEMFPEGSVVIDPWRYLKTEQSGVTIIPLGSSG